MAEWSNAHAWKACLPKGNQGSNPCPSATHRKHAVLLRGFGETALSFADAFPSSESSRGTLVSANGELDLLRVNCSPCQHLEILSEFYHAGVR